MSNFLRLTLGLLALSLSACTAFEQMVTSPTPTLDIQRLDPTGIPTSIIISPTFTAVTDGIPVATFQHNFSVTETGPHLVLNFYGTQKTGNRFIDVTALEVYEAGTQLRLQSFHNFIAVATTDSFTTVDVNFDGYLDLQLLAEPSAGPNLRHVYWIYDPIRHHYVYRPDLQTMLVSPLFDANTRQVHSFERRSPEQANETIYTWAPDGTLQFAYRNQVILTDSDSQTNRWIAYQAPELPLTFEYPDEWQFVSTAQGVQFTINTSTTLDIVALPIVAPLKAEDVIAQSSSFAASIQSLQEVQTVENIQRFDAQTTDQSTLTFFVTNSTLYAFSLKTADMTAGQQDRIEQHVKVLLHSVTITD